MSDRKSRKEAEERTSRNKRVGQNGSVSRTREGKAFDVYWPKLVAEAERVKSATGQKVNGWDIRERLLLDWALTQP
jgi:hypothetical protein